MTILVPELGFSAGTETVLLKVLPRWVDAGQSVILAAPPYRLRHYQKRGMDRRIKQVEIGWPGTGWRRSLRAIESKSGMKFLRDLGFRDQVQRERATHVFLPWVVKVRPLNFGVPTGVMLMDLAWRHYPEGWFGSSARDMDDGLKRWLEMATIIFPVSESTEAEVKTEFAGLESKLFTVPHGSEWKGRAHGKLECNGVSFLTPAGLTPNKDHLGLLTAAIKLWKEGLDFRLVWTGRDTQLITSQEALRGPHLEALRRLHDENMEEIAGRLQGLGFVTNDELDRLYVESRRVVLPSTYEGFGLPVIEAFERGARVLCTTIAPFKEQVRRHCMEDRVTLVPPKNTQALAEAMKAACLENSCDDQFNEIDLRRRVERWTWERAAHKYLDHFKNEVATQA